MPDQRDMSAQTNNRGLSIHMTAPCCYIFIMVMLLKRLGAAVGFNDLAAFFLQGLANFADFMMLEARQG